MKKFRLLLGAMAVCAISYTGYTAHEKATMTAEELAIMENVEALANIEGGGGNAYACYDSYELNESFWGSGPQRFRACEPCNYITAYNKSDRAICYK